MTFRVTVLTFLRSFSLGKLPKKWLKRGVFDGFEGRNAGLCVYSGGGILVKLPIYSVLGEKT